MSASGIIRQSGGGRFSIASCFLCIALTHSRRSNTYDTSDSEGGGKLNLTAAQAYSRRQLNAVPTVVEPTDNMDDAMSPVQPHPDYTYPASASPRPSAVNHSLSHQSMRFSMLGGGNSDSDWERAAPDRRRSVATTVRSATSNTPSTWAPRRVMLLRTASDGADVVADNQGLEWAVANGHGTGKRLDADASVAGDTDDLAPSGTSAAEAVGPLVVPTGVDALRGATLRRSHSLQDRAHYRGMHVCDAHHLAVDVGMCEMVWNLRKRERLLAKRAADMAVSPKSVKAAARRSTRLAPRPHNANTRSSNAQRSWAHRRSSTRLARVATASKRSKTRYARSAPTWAMRPRAPSTTTALSGGHPTRSSSACLRTRTRPN